MSQDQSLVHNLIQWGNLNEAYLNPKVEIGHDPVTGLSLKAVDDMPPGAKVITSSHLISLSYLNAINSPGFPCRCEKFPTDFLESLGQQDPNIIGHFFLMQQYIMGKESFWWDYIRLLPQPDQQESLRIPVWWPEADRKFLEGTNAEPPIQIRKELWKAEWNQAIAVLQNEAKNWQDYSYVLYQWAATIFGSRSFRASLTIPEGILCDALNQNHVEKDHFSVLLPILDIGNHNGINNVDWKLDFKGLSLMIRNTIPRGQQIYNYYGNKSNSELLIAYGFTLPPNTSSDLDRDVVHLKLKPDPIKLALRRSQHCHVLPLLPEEEIIFTVQQQAVRKSGLEDLRVFSEGFIDLIICMVANKREVRYISANPDYCPENDEKIFEGYLSRSSLHALVILSAKLQMEQTRITESGIGLVEPTNDNQRLALNYRNRQLAVLAEASYKIGKRLGAALEHNSICQHRDISGVFSDMNSHVQILSLECAFDWLRIEYLEVYYDVVRMIAEDQEETLPLDWSVLVEDWDHTYWIVWIFTVCMVWALKGEAFGTRHKSMTSWHIVENQPNEFGQTFVDANLSSWLLEMNQAFNSELVSDTGANMLYADLSEEGTINLMIQGIIQIPQFSNSHLQKWLGNPAFVSRLRNFASFVAQEETFSVRYKMHGAPLVHCEKHGELIVEQKVLCISKRKDAQHDEGTWTELFGKSPALRSESTDNDDDEAQEIDYV